MTGILCVLITGACLHKKRHIHVPLMVTGILADLTVVIILEFNRGAIAKAIERSSTQSEILFKIHLATAIITLVGYGIALYTGRRLYTGHESIRPFHRFNAKVVLLTRTIVSITSFWVVD
jgi:hypothetical protein